MARHRSSGERKAWLNGWIAVLFLLGLGVVLIACGEGERGEEAREEPTLRKVLRKAELPPLSGDISGKGERDASRAPLPDLDELSLKHPEFPEKSVELPDFTAIRNVERKKRRFFEFVGNLLRAENLRIRRDRYRLLKQYRAFRRGEPLSGGQTQWLKTLCGKYREPFGDGPDPGLYRDLLLKVDAVPVELGVAQAANESAWGTSRFAWVGNNLFGQWCFEKGCGLVPIRRSPGSTHEVKAYASPLLSVRDYMNNLNSHPAYREFRVLRYRQRRSRSGLDAMELARGLLAYSGIGQEYVHRLQNIMKQYAGYREQARSDTDTEQG
jgi:Bax protein